MANQLLRPGVLDEGSEVGPVHFRGAAADVELMKVEQLGGLAQAVFERIAGIDGDAKGLFSGEALAGYTESLGRDVRVDEVQAVLNDLMAANIVMRRGHGLYGLTDPFVQEIWRERQALTRPPENGPQG